MSIASSPSAAPLSGPCAGARNNVDSRCAEAERLAQAAVAHQQRLRDVRRQLGEVGALRDADARVRDRRQLDAAKTDAREAYHESLVHATGPADVHEAARVWLREIDRLNRQLRLADRRAEDVVRRASELEHALPGIELAADAARIAAEAAQVGCMEARRTLAECEAKAQRRISTSAVNPTVAAPAPAAQVAAHGSPSQAVAQTHAWPRGFRPITLVLRGDRQMLLTLALHLAEETGVEAGRLQLMLLELREAIAAQALADNALRFPPNHPFWGQFSAENGRQIAAGLASMGYRFDGRDGWQDARVPTMRELAVALAHVGLDPRASRRPAGQEAVDTLWQGATVAVEEYLAGRAPDLQLEAVMACAGSRAARLSELWDMWGRLRPLLLSPAT
jgi:hypothetical protein